MKVYVRFAYKFAVDIAQACGAEKHCNEAYEQYGEDSAGDKYSVTQTDAEVLGVADVVDKVQRTLSTSQKEYHKAQQQAAPVGYGLQSVGRCPGANYGIARIKQIAFLHGKFGAEKQGAYGHTQQHTAYEAIEEQKGVESVATVDIAGFRTVFVAHGLQHKTEQYEHPQPVCAAETGGVKQRE